MTCQSYHCQQGRQPCPTPYTCRNACATLRTANSDGTDPHGTAPARNKTALTPAPKRGPMDGISLFFLTLACAGGLVTVLAMLAGYLSVKSA